mgnify:CR=1 FL=1
MCWLGKFFGGTVERASPPDIIPKTGIQTMCFDKVCQVIIDYSRLNIPFTRHPNLIPIMDIPDTNSMDGYMDIGHNPLYIEPANEANHKIMLDWLEEQFYNTKGMLAADCVYRVMANPQDNPKDFSRPALFYAIHRIKDIGQDKDGRFWRFKGINNSSTDPYKVRDRNIFYLNTGVIH